MNNICVFCGSSSGNHPKYTAAAAALGQLIAREGRKLIYGGGDIGLMGTIADSVLAHGGEVTGVIPEFLMKKEVGHKGLTELLIVDSMHERKQRMAAMSDAFIALPGGFGTLEELAEILTWVQLSLIKKPVAILNLEGFFDPLIDQLDKMMQEGFLQQDNRELLIELTEVEGIVKRLERYTVKAVVKKNLDRT